MTRRRIELVCAAVGLTLVGGGLVIDAIAFRVYNCNPDPYFPDECTGQGIAFSVVLFGPWLVATYLLARREAIGLFACLFMGVTFWFAMVASLLLHEYLRHAPFGWSLADLRDAVLVGGIIVPVFGLLTAAVGFAMQGFIRARRRRNLLRASATQTRR